MTGQQAQSVSDVLDEESFTGSVALSKSLDPLEHHLFYDKPFDCKSPTSCSGFIAEKQNHNWKQRMLK